jgi:hypothetical protein
MNRTALRVVYPSTWGISGLCMCAVLYCLFWRNAKLPGEIFLFLGLGFFAISIRARILLKAQKMNAPATD